MAGNKNKQCFKILKSVIGRIVLLLMIISILDLTFREMIVRSPSAIISEYVMKMGLLRESGPLTMEEQAQYASKNCNKQMAVETQEEDQYHFLKAKSPQVKDLFLCIPKRMASKALMDTLSEHYQPSCSMQHTQDDIRCREYMSSSFNRTGATTLDNKSTRTMAANTTLSIAFTRHPYVRMILGYRHTKHVHNPSHPTGHNANSSYPAGQPEVMSGQFTGRKLLMSRHFRRKKKKSKDKYKFNEFVRKEVLLENQVKPITQICDICNHNYDLIYNLDKGLGSLKEVFRAAGITLEASKEAQDLRESKSKLLGPHTPRKFFSELEAGALEDIYKQFQSDFGLLGYNPNFYES